MAPVDVSSLNPFAIQMSLPFFSRIFCLACGLMLTAIQTVVAGTVPADSSRVFLRWEASRNSLYVGETFLLRLKLYYSGNISAPEDYPKLKLPNCWLEELPEKSTPVQQTINGMSLGVATLKTYLVMPQKSGRLTIDSYAVSIRVTVPPKPDDFFQVEQTVSQSLRSQPLDMPVLPLPEPRPVAFSGGVGMFDWQVQVATDSVEPQKSIPVTYRISGTGNLIFTALPVFAFPAGIEGFEVTSTDAIRATPQGMTGSRTFTQTLVAANPGTYTLPFAFAWFDPVQKTYRIQTDTLIMVVAAKAGSSSETIAASVSETTLSLQEFPRWHSPSPQWQPRHYLWQMPLFWILLGLPIALIAGMFGWAWQQRHRRQSPRWPYRQALQQLRRLQKQADTWSAAERSRHLEDILWTYLCARWGIRRADGYVDRLQEVLHTHGVSEATCGEVVQFLEACAAARFAPEPPLWDASQPEALHTLLMHLQRPALPKPRQRVAGLWMLVFGLAYTAYAATPDHRYQQAQQYYQRHQPDSAVIVLQGLLHDGYSTAEVYNALANTYVQQQKTGLAVWCYEKALRLSPDDTLVAGNLTTLRQKKGLVTPVRPPLNRWLSHIPVDSLFWLAVGLLWLGAAGVVGGTLDRISRTWKRVGLLLAGVGLLSVMAGWVLHSYQQHLPDRIVITGAKGYYAPSMQSREVVYLPEGAWVSYEEDFSGWTKVRTTDGKKVWVPQEKLRQV